MTVNWESLEVKTFNQDIILKMNPADSVSDSDSDSI